MEIFETIGVVDWVPQIWHLVIRLLFATVAGFMIGLERRSRAKDAGVKTMTVLCITACLLMIVSKYAFVEMIGLVGIDIDPTRIASTIITGLSFIGAGILLYKRESIKNLSTAVTICLNVAIGMAFGSGMLVMGSIVTILVLLIQVFLHTPFRMFKTKKVVEIRVQFIATEEYIEEFKKKYNVNHFVQFRTTREKDHLMADAAFYCYNKITSEELFASMSKDEKIKYFEKVEEN